jgi:multisubunit Na+/H+ antiporter MnhE subunit
MRASVAASITLFAGLFVFWCLAALGGGWPLPVSAALGVVAAVLAVWAGRRLRVADAEGAAAFAYAAQTALLMTARAPARTLDALRVLAAALGARDKAPVFVRLKLKPASAVGGAAVIAAASAAPGAVVVDADAGSLLAHVLVEADVDVAAMQALERAALAGAGGGRR